MAALIGYVFGDSNHTWPASDKWSDSANSLNFELASELGQGMTSGNGYVLYNNQFAPNVDSTRPHGVGETRLNVYMRDDVATAVAAFPALEIIAIAAITNDIRQPVGLPDVAVDQVLQITRSIQLQVQFIQNNWPDLKIMVLQCPPLGISARSSDETNTSRFAINDWIATYGAGVGFIPVLCYEPLLDVDPPGDDGINGDSSFYTDDIHYSAAGHVVVGAAVDLALAPHV